ncbi:MAG: DNA primase [Treponemataceae bacterium]|nr:DNA primase [Treponemataceae bacterium]
MAGHISKETIEAVQNASDIVGVIGEYTKLEPRGSDWWGCCPFHNEKTASFHVEPERKFYYCFGCHAGGDVIKFIMEQEKLSYADAIHALAKRAGIAVRYTDGGGEKPDPQQKRMEECIELYERTASMFHYLLTETEMGRGALEYITKRGISMQTIQKFRLGYAPADRRWLKSFLLKKHFSPEFLDQSGLFSKNYRDVAFFSNRLMFPIFNRRGQVVAFGGRQLDRNPDSPKYLNSGDMIQYKKGETLFAFNFAKKAIKEKKAVIFCEGYMDCIAYHQCGIENAVAPLGTALTEEQIRIVQPFVDEVLLSFDSDGAGQKATMRGILMLRQKGITVKVIRLSGGKDPAEIMLHFGREALTNAVSSAILDSNFLLSKLGEEYALDTPEGKAKASLVFFSYVDALQSDIQKESSLEQLGQAFNLKMEAVRRDFQNRELAQRRTDGRQTAAAGPQRDEIKRTAELRGVLAATADLDKYKLMQAELSADDFEDPAARQLFTILEACFKDDALSLPGILARCGDSRMQELIAGAVSSGEFRENTEEAVRDFIRLLQKKSIERKKEKIMERIRTFTAATADDQKQLQRLLAEKMELDRKFIH